MPKMYPLLESFAAGEITPKLFSRSTTAAYLNGAAILENCVTTTHGPTQRRGGLKFIRRDQSSVVRLMKYKHDRNTAFLLVLLESGVLLVIDVSFGVTPTLETTLAHPYADDALDELQYDAPPNKKEVIIVGGGVQMQQITYDPDGATGADRWTINAYAVDNKPAVWTGTNWPRTITYYQGRMWLASTDEQPETIWASQSGDFDDFFLGEADDDGLEYTVSEKGRIEWMVGVRTLLFGSASGEHVATDSNGGPGVLTPSELDINQQSAFGSRAMQPIKIGNLILYVSPDGKKIRDVGYQWEEDGWLSRDITFISEHMAKKDPIVRMAFAQHPENHLWAITESGKLQGGTYELSTKDITAETVGWHRHFTQGQFKDVVNIDVAGTSQTYFASTRTLPGEVDPYIYIEIYDPEVYLDSYEVVDLAGGTRITGVTHLAGLEVRPLVDGAVQPKVTLDASGEADVLYPGNECYVGLSYLPKIKTLPLDLQMPNERGSATAHVKRWNKIFVRVLESAKPIINGIRPPTRHPATPMDTAELPVSDNIEVSNFGWDRFAQVTIEQDLPVPMTITGVFGEVAQEIL